MLETLLSVIIPVYNVEPYLEQCLDSVINQTYKNMEIICINDGSTDNSLKILEKYKLKDKRIKIISQENKGLSEVRNVGLKIAKGKYIGFVDSDDFIEPTMYEKLVTPMLKDPSIDFAVTDVRCFFEKNYFRRVGVENRIEPRGKNKVVMSFPPCYNVAVWNKVFKREIIQNRKINLPKERYHQDHVFTHAYLVNSKYAYCIPERLYNYRIRKNSICGIKNEENHEKLKLEEWKACLHFYEYLKKNGLFEQHKNYAENFLRWEIFYMSVHALQTFYGKWLFIKEFWKFLVKSDYPIDGKISLSWALVKNLLLWCCYKLVC